ncbi:MAG: beta-galactosidase GalB [Polyangiaceae bacterium]
MPRRASSSEKSVSLRAKRDALQGLGIMLSGAMLLTMSCSRGNEAPATSGAAASIEASPRSRVSLNDGWRFQRGDPPGAEALAYANARAWVLPSGNAFVNDPARRATRPAGNLGDGVAYLAASFDDSAWRSVSLPHDYAIEGPYSDAISSSMGRLPSTGVAWYRKSFSVPEADADKSFFVDLDGAMSFSMVWVNGQFAGGWPYGYASYRVPVSSLIQPGRANTITIRVDNPVPADAKWDNGWSRWYPGAGIYRNVWLVTSDPVHVAHWGTRIVTPTVTVAAATIELDVSVDNDSAQDASATVSSEIYELDASGARVGAAVATLGEVALTIPAGSSATARTRGELSNPKRWGPLPTQKPQRYVAVTSVRSGQVVLDRYETPFGVRTLRVDPERGLLVNGQLVKLNGVCIHHDLGPLGAAFNWRARERQLELLAGMGSNAIRTAHVPFEPELFELADRLGLLVVDEAFDVWRAAKASFDYNTVFDDWHEQDLRALIRRDRNHPSVILWSIGNEVNEQQDAKVGPELAQRLTAISHEEDPTRLTTAGMNVAEPDNPFSVPIDTIGLNYQGTGVRDKGAQYAAYHERFPEKLVYGSETVSTFSSRGVYLFPVTRERRTVATGSSGVDEKKGLVSSYDLYHADWSYTPDEEFEAQDKWPFVAGEFVWTGIDYLGEPTPLDAVASSSYFGIIDVAGLKKDRFYLYQARWRPEHAMAHILPHWTWPERVGQVTPVHVYTSGDSAELFVNGVSRGRKTKGQHEYRLRWDDVVYAPGEVRVVAYKAGVEWAHDRVQTSSAASQLELVPDRATIAADGRDLSFVTLSVLDAEGRLAPRATNLVNFTLSGPGELVATSNGDATNRVVFSSAQRSAFSGKAVAIVRALPGQAGEIVLSATSLALAEARVSITAR